MKLKEINSVAIFGMGLIGGSIAKDLKLNNPSIKIFGTRKSINTKQAQQEAILDEIIAPDDLPLKNIDLIIIATPIDAVLLSARKIKNIFARHPSKKCIVMDVSSVKKDITLKFEQLSINSNIEFVSTHPMAGTEFNGFSSAITHLFAFKTWIICKHKNNTDNNLRTIEEVISSFESKIKYLDATQHDKYVALISHMTILLSNQLFNFVSRKHPSALELAGDSFLSTTRLASGNPDLHATIVKHNHQEINNQLSDFIEELKETNLQELSTDYFLKNKNSRDNFLKKRKT